MQRAALAERDRSVDAVRVTALLLVVIGHWLVQGLWIDGAGVPRREGLLASTPWMHPLTWGFQVIPVFFIVGGRVNALSWEHALAAGESHGRWLDGRTRRLTGPLIALLATWAAIAILARDQTAWLEIAARAALVPIWFIAAYLPVVALVPFTWWAWSRWGWWTVTAGTVTVALIEGVALATHRPEVAAANVLLVWATVHQLGYAWHDGRLSVRGGQALTVVAVTTLIGLVTWGPYAVSMVGVSGFGVDNTDPPRGTLLVLAFAQAGLVVVASPALQRWCRAPWLWTLITVIEARLMTIYLWHMSALGLTFGVVAWLELGGRDEPGSATWWTFMPLWIGVLVGVTAGLVTLVGPLERHLTGGRDLGRLHAIGRALGSSAVIAVVALGSLVTADGQARWWPPVVAAALLASSGFFPRTPASPDGQATSRPLSGHRRPDQGAH